MHHLLVVYGKLFLQLQEKSGSMEGASFSSCHLLYRCGNARQNLTLIPHICF